MLFWAGSTQADPALSYESILQLIKNKNIQSIEGLLAELPAPYLEKNVLILQSESLQGSTPKEPRVVFFGGDSKLLLSITGPRQPGGNRVEIIEYNEGTKSFAPREILFSPNREDWNEDRYGQIRALGPSGAYARSAPKTCVFCHGRADFHPIWEASRFWPSAYGGVGDRFAEGSKELADWKTFHAHAGETPRYRVLSGRGLGSGLGGEKNAHATLNGEFLESLTRLNAERIVDRIRRSPDYTSYRYAIYGALLGCANIDSMLPRSLPPSRRTLSDLLEEMKANQVELEALTAEELKRTGRGTPEEAERAYGDLPTMASDSERGIGITAGLRYLFENRGISMKDWSLSFDASYAFANPIDRDGWGPYARAFEAAEPGLRELKRSFSSSADLCLELMRLGNELVASRKSR